MLRRVFVLLLVLSVTAAVFAPCLRNGFVDWDDAVLLTANPLVQTLSWSHLVTIVSRPLTNAYHPFPFLVWSLEYLAWGAVPLGYHLVNLLLHLGTVALVFRWVARVEGSLPAAVGAALFFALHPMRVESVAWVSDLKDLLAGFFFMGALLQVENTTEDGRYRQLGFSLGLYALAMFSKGTAITLPAVLALRDLLRRRPMDRDWFAEKGLYVVMAVPFAVAAIAARGEFEAFIGRELGQEPYPIWYRVYVAGYRLVFYYLRRTVAPSGGMANLYPDLGGVDLGRAVVCAGVIALLGAAMALSWRFSRKVTFGLGFFLVTLAPSLAVVSYGYTADRFSYVPSIGLAYLVGVWIAGALRGMVGRRSRSVALSCLVGAGGLLGAMTWQRCGVWKDSISLWTDAVLQFEPSPASANLGIALSNRGRAWLARGDYGRAVQDLDRALPLAPDRHHTLYYRALAYAALGEKAKAEADVGEALDLAPDDVPARQLLEALSPPLAPVPSP